MNYYFLPGVGIYGGIKVAFQFADALTELGVKIVVATPDGQAPRWFSAQTPVMDRDQALARLSETDVALFSLPHDYDILRRSRARLVLHCQGTDPLIDPILADSEVTVLTCWAQASDYAQRFGRQPIEVGISIPDCLFYDGTPKHPGQVAFMPRRGAAIAADCAAATGGCEFVAIDGDHENVVAKTLKQSTYYLATSEGEWFGLPALEAMAAGCIVASVPVVGGGEYLIDQRTCRVTEAAHLPALLKELTGTDSAPLRSRILAGGRTIAANYRTSLHKRRLADQLNGALKDRLSWT